MTTPTATPCRRCGTIGGCLDHKLAKPRRARGLCGACLQWVNAHGQVEDYPRVTVLHAPDEARVCEWCGGRYARGHESGQAWKARRFCSHTCSGASLHDREAVIPTGIITPAMLGIKPGQPPIDPNLTPRVVWAVGNLNARKAIGWLVRQGMDPEEARIVATWQPARATTPDAGERRAA